MSAITQSLATYLNTVGGLTALVGSRIFPVYLPKGATLPALTYNKISSPRVRSHSGPSHLAHPRIQINIWANTFTELESVAAQLVAALEAYKGLMGSDQTVSFVETELDDFDEEAEIHRRIMDVLIWHTE